MLKSVSLITAVLAGAAMLFSAMTPEAAAVAPAAKSDRADHAAACERQGWPYYEASCLRDQNRNAGRVMQVRIVTTDRVEIAQPAGAAIEPLPHARQVDAPADPLAVPAWPDYLANLKVLAVR